MTGSTTTSSTSLPPSDTVLCFQWAAFVNEDGTQLAETRLGYLGGVGVRVYPRQLLEPTGYRPADEDRTRNCDFSILHNTRQANQPTGRPHQLRRLACTAGDRLEVTG